MRNYWELRLLKECPVEPLGENNLDLPHFVLLKVFSLKEFYSKPLLTEKDKDCPEKDIFNSAFSFSGNQLLSLGFNFIMPVTKNEMGLRTEPVIRILEKATYNLKFNLKFNLI